MTSQELREKRAHLVHLADQILAKNHEDKRETLTAEDDQEWHRLHDEADALKRTAEIQDRQAKINRELEEPLPARAEPNPVRRPEERPERNSFVAMRDLARGQADTGRALRAWLLSERHGQSVSTEDRQAADRVGLNLSHRTIDINFSTMAMRSSMSPDVKEWENRALGTTSGAVGAFTVPDEMMRALEVAMLTWGGMRNRCQVIRTETGADLPWPTTNDTTQMGQRIAENTTANEQDVAFNQLVLQSFLYSSKIVRVSVQLLQDNAVNVPAVLGRLLGERIGRILNNELTLGTGTGMPLGIVPAAAVGFTAPTATTQVATWNYTSVVSTEHSVDPAYRQNAAWMMHDLSLRNTKLILDTTGRPIWAPGIIGAAPDTLLGYPIVINQDMPVMAANAKSVIFGDLNSYIIRDVLGIQLVRLDERYAEFHQSAFLAYSRHDGDLLNAGTNPVKVFVNAAT